MKALSISIAVASAYWYMAQTGNIKIGLICSTIFILCIVLAPED